ncbi:hypothetical protein SAMN05446037_100418 [Anaerovirgula multivorans]|uniref:Uncharacterized protein n=1 Tax=Anaerovirgula multivorans TaxID=312168 RepID=A0A239BMZ2_9FIRM|nr:LDCC motif putative metal-binding protein [Anaerovirgula multivorans]SNS09216.1 hypothetical protein SAMN05446037_100418 [Anaerovirgula multivorans]
MAGYCEKNRDNQLKMARKLHTYISEEEKEGIILKKWFQKLLKSIEDANKKNFGEQKMDCCDLNKQGKKESNNKK